ncbi:hypothetical protein ACH4FX_26415 [Streptomyces sp. NPDC018019]|uniref:hypothetical protein n=1 Tax=Streptomyces sp. NPDC018019 TaxID=3365030 RepID=UPI00379E1F31
MTGVDLSEVQVRRARELVPLDEQPVLLFRVAGARGPSLPQATHSPVHRAQQLVLGRAGHLPAQVPLRR